VFRRSRRNVHKRALRSSGMLRCVDWQFVSNVSVQPIGPIFKRLTLEDWTDSLSRKVDNKPDSSRSALHLKMEPTGCPETSVTKLFLDCSTLQDGTDRLIQNVDN